MSATEKPLHSEGILTKFIDHSLTRINSTLSCVSGNVVRGSDEL